MKRTSMNRYKTPAGTEAEWEPGSRQRVLKNLLGIKRKLDMDVAEYEAFLTAQEKYFGIISPTTCFTAKLLCAMHKEWLGNIYAWAGHYRTVELQKGDFRWPPAYLIEKNMHHFEQNNLAKNTPCRPAPLNSLAINLAEVHAELLLIHPFREGNGRLARWLASLMSLQAGLPPLGYDFTGNKAKHRKYITAVSQGYGKNYEPLARFFLYAWERRLT